MKGMSRMTKALVFTAWVLIAAFSTGEVLACGDKFLVASRGTRFQRPPAPRQPAAILLYASPTSELSHRLAGLAVSDALKKAGYRPTVAESPQALVASLKASHWDLVVVDVADIQMIDVRPNDSPGVVPVTYSLSGQEWSQARHEYPGIIRSPGKTRTFVDAIDAALEAQHAARAAAR
jgi:hypothetical protein